jgi:hypothetical protein
MTEQDFTKRLTVVVRKDLEGWQAANTLAHISAYIGNKLGDNFGTGDVFETKDGKTYPRNTQYPIIIKAANSDEQLHTLLEAVRNTGLVFHGFIREMIETTGDDEIEQSVLLRNDRNVELLGLGVFGDHERVNLLTNKFDLWK